MSSHYLAIGKPVLEEAIDRHPLMVSPNTLLTETLTLMSQRQHLSSSLPNVNSLKEEVSSHKVISNCVLVMEGRKLAGIFTERDLVRLIASDINFDGIKIGQVMSHPVTTLSEENFQDIFAALFLFRRYRIRHLPIVTKQGTLVGVVSHESLRSCLRPTNLLKLRRVSDVMSSNVIQASLTERVLNLAKLMAEHRVSCVVIMEELPEDLCLPVGIVTERDLCQFQALGLDLSKLQAQEVMSTPLFILNPKDSLWFAHQQMQQRHVRRLVVSWNWGLGLGIVTQTSLLRVFEPMEMYGVIETLQHTVEQLEAETIENFLEQMVERKQLGSQQTANSLNLMTKHNSDFSEELQRPVGKNIHQLQLSQPKLQSHLSDLQEKLNLLVNDPQMPPEKRKNLLSLAIADLNGLKKLLEGGDSANCEKVKIN